MPAIIQRCELVHMLNKKSKGTLPLELCTVALRFNFCAAANYLSALLQNNAKASKHLSVAIFTLWDARKYARVQTIMIIGTLPIF